MAVSARTAVRRQTRWKRLALPIALVAALTATGEPEADEPFLAAARRSVVKIYVTTQREDFTTPWQGGRISHGTGSGFVIGGRRILTNGHIVSDARFIQVQKDGDSKRYEARVAFMGFDCDLAILTVDDDAFFDNTRTVQFADALPELNDEVVVLGYPMGGQHLSITKGVVSRIDYSVYAHSGVDRHLALQVDAAINPGNSGGPVFFDGKVIGVAFQGMRQAQNIGYTIPLPVVNRFLADSASGTYDGYPELGVVHLETSNPALRRDLGLPDTETGVAVAWLDPFGAARDALRPRDVLLAIDGYNIAEDGNIVLDGQPIIFHEIIERKQRADTVEFDVWRDGEKQRVAVALDSPADPFVFRNVYDERPRYVMVGGLVFSPLNRAYLQAVARNTDPLSIRLRYYAQYAKVDGLHEGVDEFIMLIRRLPHPVNTYADGFVHGIVSRVNGQPIARLRDVQEAFAEPRDGFHTIEFAGADNILILDAAAAAQAETQIREAYGVPSAAWLGDES